MQARFATAALCAFVLITASACGGGSDGLSQTEEEALQERVEVAEAEREKAERQAAEAERKRREEQTAREAAETEAAEVEEAKEAAEDAEEARLAAEEAQRLAQEQAQQAQREAEQLEQQLTEAEQAELRARASSFGAQLDAPEAATATVSWTRGNNLTFRPNGIVLTPGSAAPSVPGGWRSASFTGQSGTATALIDETVYLYTNIQAPSSRAFWKVHNVEVADAQDGADDPMPTGTARVVRVGNSIDYADGATYDIAVSGTYDGVSGTYTCPACTIADGPDDNTDITAADFDADAFVTSTARQRSFADGTVWRFKPGSITAPVKAEDRADQDDAYLYFGVWSSIPDDIVGTYNFRYVAGGGPDRGEDFATKFATLTGPATFRGGAVGKYVTQGQVGGQNAKIGTFTATATLNADFGDGTTPGTVSGIINEFREDGSPLTGWQVTLGSETNVGVAATISGTSVTGGSTVANIGGLSVGGSWGATFYGSGNEDLMDRDKYPASRYPVVDLAGVAGWFDAADATCTNACLAGAFAATPSPSN